MQYVDDMVLAGKSDAQLAEVKEAICQCFEVEDLGECVVTLPEMLAAENLGRKSKSG